MVVNKIVTSRFYLTCTMTFMLFLFVATSLIYGNYNTYGERFEKDMNVVKLSFQDDYSDRNIEILSEFFDVDIIYVVDNEIVYSTKQSIVVNLTAKDGFYFNLNTTKGNFHYASEVDNGKIYLIERNGDYVQALIIDVFVTFMFCTMFLILLRVALANLNKNKRSVVNQSFGIHSIFHELLVRKKSNIVVFTDQKVFVCQFGIDFGNNIHEYTKECLSNEEFIENNFFNTEFSMDDKLYNIKCFTTLIEKHVYYIVMLKDITNAIIANKQPNDFLNQVGHELRSPLTSIQGSQELLLLSNILDEKSKKMVEIGVNQCTKMNKLIVKMIEIAKNTANDSSFMLVDVSNALKEVLEKVKVITQGYEIELKINIDEDIKFFTHASRIRQLFEYTIVNVIKFNKACGRINIYLKRNDEKVYFKATGSLTVNDSIDENRETNNDLFNEDQLFSINNSEMDLTLVKAICDVYRYDITSSKPNDPYPYFKIIFRDEIDILLK